MKYIKLRNTDLTLSNLCLGSANFGEKTGSEQAFEILDAFVRAGGNFIDTANVYCRWVPGLGNCSEQLLGEWLRRRGAYHNVVIATKGAHYDIDKGCKFPRVNEADIRKDLDESLMTLGQEVLSFYWLHRDDTAKPIEEIIDILERLKQEGKIRYYGLSNYRTDRLIKAQSYLKSQGKDGIYGVSNQWSLASINPNGNTNPDPTMVEYSSEEHIWHMETLVPEMPFSSTAMGFFEKLKKAGVMVKDGQAVVPGIDGASGIEAIIPDNLRKAYWNADNLCTYEKLLKRQRESGHNLQALSLAYLLNQPFQVIPVGGVRNMEQLEGFLEASEIVW